MRRKRFLIIFGALFVAAFLAVLFAPFIVASGLRLWLAHTARQHGLRIETERIEAPLLRPAVIHKLRLTNEPNAPFQIDGAMARVEIDLNLSGIFSGAPRPLHSLVAEGVTLNVRRTAQLSAPSRPFAWPVLNNLLSDNFKFSGVQLHVENGSTIVDLREGTLTGSQLESGLFTAKEVAIVSPWFQRSFSNLRGATSWQDSRLVVGALSLMTGLDLDTITVDLSALGESRIGLEVHLDAFGGKVRARVSSDDRGDRRIWDAAGDGSGISLAQMSDALAWTNRASGSLHACKFTFRGEAADVRNATASLWAEVSGLTWRDRTADVVMIGAALYNREVQVQQIYIKQRDNQLTLSGEFALPTKSADWFKPAFRGDISASISDLGDFARLLGWSPSDFSGRLLADGSVSVREQKIGGQLMVSGNSLVLFRSPIESLNVQLSLEESRLSIAQFELREKEDFFRAQGDFALVGHRSYTAAFQTSVANIADYAGFISRWTESFSLSGGVSVDWTGNGATGTNSGTFHAHGKNLRPLESSIIPFDAEFEADYSPDNIFFRKFRLWNQRADLSAFVTVAKDYFQLQTVRLSLNGQPRLEGDVFLPVSLTKLWSRHALVPEAQDGAAISPQRPEGRPSPSLRETSSWLGALPDDPIFDVDLALLDSLDLGELAAAVSSPPKVSGKVAGKFELYGAPASLDGRLEFHLRDFVFENAPAISGDLEAQLAAGMTSFKANIAATRSDVVKAEGSLPFRLGKRQTSYAFNTDGPLAATVSFPSVFLAKLPAYLSRDVFTRGILSGNLTFSNSLQEPTILGEASLIDAQFLRGLSLSTGLTFKGPTATIDFVQFKQNSSDVSGRGEIDFHNLAGIELKIVPSVSLLELTPLTPGDCVSSTEFVTTSLDTLSPRPVSELGLSGSLFARNWAVSLSGPTDVEAPQAFPFCSDRPSRRKTLRLQA
ncbi:MAG TPA: hypothetical protein VEX43_11545, partial [Chthoniobacterales bacterium]|nr:hypothetical protein [Chthoniobacterales bacterium]